MTMTATFEQQGWDLLAMVRPPYTGRAPLHFTTDWFTSDELGEAWARYLEENGHFGCLIYSHMWSSAQYSKPGAVPEGHSFIETSTDLRCTIWEHRRYNEQGCSCVGDTVTRIQCDECGFLAIGRREHALVLWHDAHWPGWRDLPVLPDFPSGPSQAKQQEGWVEEHYPEEWKVPGAPIITPRQRHSTRSVEGRSPFGGFDIATWNLRWDPEDYTVWHYDFQIDVLEAEEKRDDALALLQRGASK